ncbi:hypothetical protein GGD81_003147 [Rhodobium orientis]|nr:YARHG domain-containing protein [Rhodobium orientis]MBB4304092.1 hypothetical protein [Rhodobium orientis]
MTKPFSAVLTAACAGAAMAISVGAANAQAFTVFPDSSERALADWELETLSCQDLWVARNEIYYRNGYCFKTRRGRNFFDNSGCSTSNPPFSRVESSNVARIKRMEGNLGCR